MHKRKKFLVYPPNYKPGDGYKAYHSRLQAWKASMRLGEGTSVDVIICSYLGPRVFWNSRESLPLWEITRRA